jgi:hypothetical protein
MSIVERNKFGINSWAAIDQYDFSYQEIWEERFEKIEQQEPEPEVPEFLSIDFLGMNVEKTRYVVRVVSTAGVTTHDFIATLRMEVVASLAVNAHKKELGLSYDS